MYIIWLKEYVFGPNITHFDIRDPFDIRIQDEYRILTLEFLFYHLIRAKYHILTFEILL